MRSRVFIAFGISVSVLLLGFAVSASRQLTSVGDYSSKFKNGTVGYKVKVTPIGVNDVLYSWFESTQNVPLNVSLRNGKEGRELYVYKPKDKSLKAFQAGMNNFTQGKYKKARKQFKSAIKIDPNFHKVKLFLGDSYFMTKDYEKAAEYFVELLKVNPIDFKASLFLADSYWKMGKLNLAKQYLVRSLIFNVRNGESWGKLRRLGDLMGFTVSEDRLVPLTIFDDKSKSIKVNSEAWTHYGTCKSVWKKDNKFFTNKTGLKNYKHTIAEEVECAINLVEGLEADKRNGKNVKIPDSIRRLQAVIAKNQLYNLVLMELFLPQDPIMAASLNEKQLTDLTHYVEKYILVKGKNEKQKMISEIRRELSSKY